MKKQRVKIMLLLILIFSLSLSPCQAYAAPVTKTNIILSCNQQASVGDTVTVEVKSEIEARILGIEFTISYDPSILEPIADSNGKRLQPQGTYARLDSLDSTLKPSEDLQNGVLIYPLYNSDTSSTTTTDIGKISFKVLKEGTATIRLSDIQAVTDGSKIVNANTSSQVYVTISGQTVYTVQQGTPLTVPASATNALVDVSPLFSGNTKSATLPEINISTNTSISNKPVQVKIPNGTTISGSTDWNGTIHVPTVKDTSVLDPGTNTVYSVIEIGFDNTPLTFDQPVRLILPDQAGREAGYSRNGGPITSIPTNNGLTLTSGAALGTAQDGKKDINGDLVVWTKHFTYFVVYTPSSSGVSTSSGSGSGIVNPTPGAASRIAGNDRFETANAIAEQGWPNGADTVVLAYAFDFPDALAAAPLAKKLDAPILLTDKTTLTSSTLAEIQKLKAKKIILIGGTGVISQRIQKSLSATYGQANVTRYGGESRYATAAAIAGALGSTGKAVVVNGQNYPDALAISPYAAAQGIPILFTQASTLPVATSQVLSDQIVSTTIVAGGEGAVSAGVFNLLPGASRYGGADRYSTSTAIINGLKLKLDQVYVVTGLNFPDAMVAGNLAAYTESPLVMVDKGLPEATKTFLTANKVSITKVTIIGGQGAVSTSQVNDIQNALK